MHNETFAIMELCKLEITLFMHGLPCLIRGHSGEITCELGQREIWKSHKSYEKKLQNWIYQDVFYPIPNYQYWEK